MSSWKRVTWYTRSCSLTEIEIFEQASGDCIVCGEAAAGSVYWTPLSDDAWAALRPSVAGLFPNEDYVQNVLFIPPFNQPLCGAQCSLDRHQKEKTNGTTS